MYQPVYYILLESYIGFYQKVKINVLENCQRFKGGNRDYCRNFSLIFETTSKFLIVLVMLIFGKVVVDGFVGHDRKLTLNMNFI